MIKRGLNSRGQRILEIECDCSCSSIVIIYDEDCHNLNFTVRESSYEYHFRSKLWQRIKLAWRVLIGRKLYADDISVSSGNLSLINEGLKWLKEGNNNYGN